MSQADFATLFREHKDFVFRFAWRMTGSAGIAEDVAQDCFLALLRAPDRYDAGRGAMRAFLAGVARNIIFKRWRAEDRWDPLEEDIYPAAAPDPIEWEAAGMVRQAVQSLPPLQREAVILAEYEDMTVEEISRAVGVEASAVKARLRRARENLRRMLAPLRKPTCNH